MRTLVLNASYEPIAIVSARRAVIMVLDGVVDCVEPSGEYFRSMHLRIEAPAVVRRKQQVRAPWRLTVPVTRRGVLLRDRRRCAYCDRAAWTVDHVVPRSRGGQNEWTNVVAACGPCNHRKGNRTPAEARMALRVQPREPHGTEAFALTLPDIGPTWYPWLGLAEPSTA